MSKKQTLGLEDAVTLRSASEVLTRIVAEQEAGRWTIPWWDEIETTHQRATDTANLGATLDALASVVEGDTRPLLQNRVKGDPR